MVQQLTLCAALRIEYPDVVIYDPGSFVDHVLVEGLPVERRDLDMITTMDQILEVAIIRARGILSCCSALYYSNSSQCIHTF